jgi:predicted ATPase
MISNNDTSPGRSSNSGRQLQLHDIPLFGRSKELEILSKAYDNAAASGGTSAGTSAVANNQNINNNGSSSNTRVRGGPQIVMIKGKSGIGKSSIVAMMMKKQMEKSPDDFSVRRYKTCYCTGKFDQRTKSSSSSQPYSALRQAFTELRDSILHSDARRQVCNELQNFFQPEDFKSFLELLH